VLNKPVFVTNLLAIIQEAIEIICFVNKNIKWERDTRF